MELCGLPWYVSLYRAVLEVKLRSRSRQRREDHRLNSVCIKGSGGVLLCYKR
jgi:hypothetical protein